MPGRTLPRHWPLTAVQAWNSHSKLNCISACIAGQMSGADEALMLDPQGWVMPLERVSTVGPTRPPPQLCGHVQLDQFLHHPQGRGVGADHQVRRRQ